MIRVRDANRTEVSIAFRVEPWDAGTGPIIIELPESPAPPEPDNGILLEDQIYFLMMEDGISYLLKEA